MTEKIERLEEGERAALTTTLATVLLAGGKGIVGFFSGSLVLITDAIHSGADILPIFASWFGLKVSQRDPDEKFPYGYYKAESIAALFASLFIIYLGADFIIEGYSKLFEISEISYPFIAGGAALTSIVASGIIARYQKKVGDETGSESLIANAKESAMDVLSSSVVLLAIILSHFKVPYVEGAVTIGIAVLVLKVGLETAKDSIYGLMDVSPSEEIEKEVIKVIGNISGVEGYGNLKLRKAGPFVFGECSVMIRKFVDVDRSHEIAEQIENKVKDSLESVDSFTVHVEPYETDKRRVVIPVRDSNGEDSRISEHFGRGEYFAFVSLDMEEKEIENIDIKENEFKDKEIRAGLSASRFVAGEKIDALITKEIGEISFHSLRDQLVDIYDAKGEDVVEISENFMEEKLERLSEPTREKDQEVIE
ncbi:MAG: cation diffusion facilitator family transporter [Candidatus Aenigmatarchaeota archaeon]